MGFKRILLRIFDFFAKGISKTVYVTERMDILGGSCRTAAKCYKPNGFWDEHKHFDRVYEKQICLDIF